MTDMVTGIDVLRATLRARDRAAGALTRIAREVGVSVSSLENFVAGTADFDLATLKKLTPVLHSNTEYDEESGLLRSANRAPPIPAGTPPPPYKPPANYVVAKYKPLPAAPGAKAKPKPRPGWLDGWI